MIFSSQKKIEFCPVVFRFFFERVAFFGDVVEGMVRRHRAVRVYDATVLQKKCQLEVCVATILSCSQIFWLDTKGFVGYDCERSGGSVLWVDFRRVKKSSIFYK